VKKAATRIAVPTAISTTLERECLPIVTSARLQWLAAVEVCAMVKFPAAVASSRRGALNRILPDELRTGNLCGGGLIRLMWQTSHRPGRDRGQHPSRAGAGATGSGRPRSSRMRLEAAGQVGSGMTKGFRRRRSTVACVVKLRMAAIGVHRRIVWVTVSTIADALYG
jgi:hypothetical protein